MELRELNSPLPFFKGRVRVGSSDAITGAVNNYRIGHLERYCGPTLA